MPVEITDNDKREIVSLLQNLQSTIFAGALSSNVGSPVADCSCQNCGCDSRAGGSCGCDPKCSCQGYTASGSWESLIRPLIGIADILPINEVESLIKIKERIKEAQKKAFDAKLKG